MNKSTLLFAVLLCSLPFAANAQQYLTREGQVRFFSTTPSKTSKPKTSR